MKIPVGAGLGPGGVPTMNDNAVHLMKFKTLDTQLPLDKAAYDAWFKAQVQASLEEPHPSIPNEDVKRLKAIKRDKIPKEISL
jgi:hypothetical protein